MDDTVDGKNSPQDVQHKNDMSEDQSLSCGRLGGTSPPAFAKISLI